MAPRTANTTSVLVLHRTLAQVADANGLAPPTHDGVAVQVSVGDAAFRLEPLDVGTVRDRDADRVVAQVAAAGPEMVAVADRISGTARIALNHAGLSWLDLRGHLHVNRTGLLLDSPVEPAIVPTERVQNVWGGAGMDLAVALLIGPDEQHGVRELAGRLGRSPGRISELLAALRSMGLVTPQNRPVVPELFWDTAEQWSTRWRPVDARGLAPLLRGGVLSGTAAGLELGAPIVAGTVVPEVYLRNPRVLPTTEPGTEGAIMVAEPPAPAVLELATDRRWTIDGVALPVAHPVVVALDLAQDRSRGHEVLEEWSPHGYTRVW